MEADGNFNNFLKCKFFKAKNNFDELFKTISCNFFAEDISERYFLIDETKAKLALYKRQIESLTEEVKELKKENGNYLEELKLLKYDKRNINEMMKSTNEMMTSTNEIFKILLDVKGEVNDIRKTFFGEEKDIKDIQNNIHKILMNKIKQRTAIESFEHEMSVANMHSASIFSPLVLSDKRIVTTGTNASSILISSINYQTKKWKQDILKENAHSNNINSFLELTDNRFITCSNDYSIKVWKFSENNLTEVKKLTSHSNNVYKLVLLDNNRFASASHDSTIRIWSTEEPYTLIQTLNSQSNVFNLLFLKDREILISSYSGGLEFWNIKSYKKENTMSGYYCYYNHNSFIELPNQKIAVSNYSSPYSIFIIDTIAYSILRQIKLEGYITNYSCLFLLDAFSLIYIYEGNVVQISLKDYSILYTSKSEQQLRGYNFILSVKDGKYLMVDNKSKGFDLIKPRFIFHELK